MGVESYLLRLSGKNIESRVVAEFAERELGLVPDVDQISAIGTELFYVLRDGRHVIEFEFVPGETELEISLRFALCNPATVDDVFIRLVKCMLERFDATVMVSDELPMGNAKEFSRLSKDAFTNDCRKSIERSRGYWRGMFGSREAGISVSEALRTIVLPQCDPVHS